MMILFLPSSLDHEENEIEVVDESYNEYTYMAKSLGKCKTINEDLTQKVHSELTFWKDTHLWQGYLAQKQNKNYK